MKRSYHFVLFTFFTTLILQHQAQAAGTPMTWTIDGVQREALVFAPSSNKPGQKHPVIFGFHGHGGNMNRASMGMHFQDLWPEAIVVYPQGLPTTSRRDPNGNFPGWQSEVGQDGDRDLKFFDAMLSDLKKKYSVDSSKVFTVGFSNGSIFSYLLWAERAKDLAAIGICAGRIGANAPTEARPLIAIAGQNDRVLPFSEQESTLATARQVDHAEDTPKSCGENCSLYSAGKSGSPVMVFIHPGGHMFPPWASQAMVNFFKKETHS